MKRIALAIVLVVTISGCADKELQFSFAEGSWQAKAKNPGTPFRSDTIRIEVATDVQPEPRPTAEEVALIRRVLEALPALMPVITQELGKYDESLKDPKTFREQLKDPAICLFKVSKAPNPPGSWTFTVERPSVGSAFGYHLEFQEQKFIRIWAGD